MQEILDFNRDEPVAHFANRMLSELLVGRLNYICKDPEIRAAVQALCENRVPVTKAVGDHPSLQVSVEDGTDRLGLLGLLNGITGILPEGPKKGWGHITAIFDDGDGSLLRFELTEDS
jgi:hypothetical protein